MGLANGWYIPEENVYHNASVAKLEKHLALNEAIRPFDPDRMHNMYSPIPIDILRRLTHRYDEADIAVLADWCETMGAMGWHALLTSSVKDNLALQYYHHATAVMLLRTAYLGVADSDESNIGWQAVKLTIRWTENKEEKKPA